MKFYAPKYKQLDLGLLRSSLDELDKTNRWVALGDLLPWTELEKEYNSRLDNQKKGAGNKPARMILGAMIIKHKLNLSDAETIEIAVAFDDIGAVETVGFDGVTAGLRVNADVHAPLLCVTDVFDVASGDLSLPGKVNQ